MIGFTALVPLLMPAVTAAIGIVEQIFKTQSGAGPQKKQAVMETLRVLTGKMVATGQLPAEPSDSVLSDVIEQMVLQANDRAAAAFVNAPIPPAPTASFPGAPVSEATYTLTFKGNFTITGGPDGRT